MNFKSIPYKPGKSLAYETDTNLLILVSDIGQRIVSIDAQTRIPTLAEMVEVKEKFYKDGDDVLFTGDLTSTLTTVTLIPK